MPASRTCRPSKTPRSYPVRAAAITGLLHPAFEALHPAAGRMQPERVREFVNHLEGIAGCGGPRPRRALVAYLRRVEDRIEPGPPPPPAPSARTTTVVDATAPEQFAIGSGRPQESAAAAPAADPVEPPAETIRVSPRIADAALYGSVALAVVSLAYYAIRFLVAATPPRLTEIFRGSSHAQAFASAGMFDGALLTNARDLLIGVVYTGTTIWLSSRTREPLARLLGAVGALAGLYSMAVTVLTSTETIVAVRVVAAAVYCVLPAVMLVVLAVYPTGRPVPRWSVYAVPVGIIPFVLQGVSMLRAHEFSFALGDGELVATVAFLGFQIHRYRRHATPRDRHRIKWLSYACGVFMTFQAVAVAGVLPLLANTTRAAFPLLKVLYELLLAAAYLIGLATILFSAARYRLWQIDRVINRTAVYVLVTMALAGTAAVTFFALDGVLSGAFAAPLATALSLALALAAFAPARRLIARWIDRTFYGIGINYDAIAVEAVYAASLELPRSDVPIAGYGSLVLLGRGGMGAVYRARHPELAVPIALKVMSPTLATRPAARDRFRREAEILARLRHPNVIPFVAAGHECGLEFVAMEYIEGEDLATVAERTGPMALADIVPLVEAIASALDLAHRRGVVHRDVKPANILLEGSASEPVAARRPLLCDFGVARLPEDDARQAPRDALIGSLPYMSPEQIQTPNQVDGRADVYSLGATIYKLVTGHSPFREQTSLGMVLAHLGQPPDDPRTAAPELPASASAAILRALAKAPADRFATAGELAAALRAALPARG